MLHSLACNSPWVLHAVEALIALIAIELGVLMARRRGAPAHRLSMASGLALLVAWRLSAGEAPAAAVAGVLALAGLAHLGEWAAHRRANRGASAPGAAPSR